MQVSNAKPTPLDQATCEVIAAALGRLIEQVSRENRPAEYGALCLAKLLVREMTPGPKPQQSPEPPAPPSARALDAAAAIRAYHREHSAVLTERGLAAIIDRETGLPKLLAANATMLAALELLDAEAAGDSPYLWQQVSEAILAGRATKERS